MKNLQRRTSTTNLSISSRATSSFVLSRSVKIDLLEKINLINKEKSSLFFLNVKTIRRHRPVASRHEGSLLPVDHPLCGFPSMKGEENVFLSRNEIHLNESAPSFNERNFNYRYSLTTYVSHPLKEGRTRSVLERSNRGSCENLP